MRDLHSILVASDTSQGLLEIIKSLDGFTSYSCITTKRILDAIHVLKSLNPSLIIIHFTDNQRFLSCLKDYGVKISAPVLCLTKPYASLKLIPQENIGIIRQPFDYAIKDDILRTTVSGLIRISQQQHSNHIAKPMTINADLLNNEHKNLARYTLELDQKMALMRKTKEEIEKLFPSVDHPTRIKLMSIVNLIKTNKADERHWEDFKLYFEKINPDFLKHLSRKHPQLTPKDLKYCCYVKMNMSNEDIRNILGINQESVRTHKYRLKKKMTLPKHQDLRHYLRLIS